MLRFLLLLLCALLTLGEASATLSAPPGRHRPHYTAYKHRGAARKRWRRMGVIGRWRYKRRYQKNHPKRGIIRVGPPRAHMPRR
jgi:hypothetical protein